MSTAEFRAWLESLAEAEATIPARVVLQRLPETGEAPAPPQRAQEPDRLLSVDEVAERLGVHRSWIYRRKNLPFAKKVGGSLRFSERGLTRWMESR